jgi:uncharacterized membrane protein
MNTVIFLGFRALHVLCAAVWIGSSVFASALLVPAIESSGPSGGQVMMTINRRGINRYMGFLGATTVVTGLYLLWRFTGGFDPGVAASHAGLAFGVGGAAGVLAAIVGGAVVGRSAGKVVEIMGQAVVLPDGPARGALVERANLLRQRMKIGSKVTIVLQAIALVLMALGHYV